MENKKKLTKKVSKKARSKSAHKEEKVEVGETTEQKKLSGRRGFKTRSIVAQDIDVPDAPKKLRIRAALVDFFFIITFSEVLIFRNVLAIFNEAISDSLGRLVIYLAVCLLIYLGPLRIFGQSIGMKVFKLKILNESDLSFVKYLTLFQRQIVGPFLLFSIGLVKFLKKDEVILDEIFKTKVAELEKN